MMVIGALIGPVTQSVAVTRAMSGVAVAGAPSEGGEAVLCAVSGGAGVCDSAAAVGEGCGVVVGAAVALGMAVGKTGLGQGVADGVGASVKVGRGGVGVGARAGARQAASSTPAAAIQPARHFNTRASFISARL